MFKGIKSFFTDIRNILAVIVGFVIQIAFIMFLNRKFDYDLIESIVVYASTSLTTILFMLKPLYAVIVKFAENETMRRDMEMKDLKKAKKESDTKIEQLESEKRHLEGRVKIMQETQTFASGINSEFNIQVCTVSKSGYIVKEEKLADYACHPDLKQYLPREYRTDKGRIRDRINRCINNLDRDWNGEKTILYIHKGHYKYSIGFKCGEVMYAKGSDGKYYLKNVALKNLHKIGKGVEEHKYSFDNDINHTFILQYKENESRIKIVNDETKFSKFLSKYNEYHDGEISKSVSDKVDVVCKEYTKALHKVLTLRHKEVVFVEDVESQIQGLVWHTLNEGCKDDVVALLISDLFVAFQTIKLCSSKTLDSVNVMIPENNGTESQVSAIQSNSVELMSS